MADNYRSISLPSICCKFFEKFARKHSMDNFNEKGLITNAQYGFRSGRSMNLQLLKVVDDFTRAMDKHEKVDVIYLDFKKAFDSVPRKRLIGVLRQYGVTGRTLNWITDFLSGPKQRVVINNSRSSWQPVKSGIPQGSVLGPVLFLIDNNTMPDKIASKIYLFADDAKLYRKIEDKSDVARTYEDLQSLETSSGQSLLSFNIDKCFHMTIGTKKMDTERIFKINGENIKEVQLEKDLGIWLDNEMTFETDITKKANKENGMIAVIVFFNIYKCLIRPHLEFANLIWHPRVIKHQIILENVQKRATRLVSVMKNLSYYERLKELNLSSLEYRRKRRTMIKMYKICYGLYDRNATAGLFERNDRDYRGNACKVVVRKANLEMLKNFFTIRAPLHWNNLPQETVQSKTIDKFKWKLDKHWKTIGIDM